MKVALIPSDVGACGFYRVAWPGNAVRERGHEVHLYDPTRVEIARMPMGGVAVKGLENLQDMDLVVVQRVKSRTHLEFIQQLQDLGIAVVVDVDDALWRIDPDNKSYDHWSFHDGAMRRWEYLDLACAIADLVTVATPALARRYGGHARVEVLRNGLPNRAFSTNPKTSFQGRIRLGWSGSIDSHPHDLDVLGDSVKRIMAENDDVDLHIVGDAEPVAAVLGVEEFGDRVTGTGWVPLDQYHAALTDIDIMLVPLADTFFNRCKSALKAQEGAAAGAVVLASATPENERLYGLGGFAGGIVDQDASDHVWHVAIQQAIQTARAGAGADPGPERVRFLEYGSRGDKWEAAWQWAIDRRKKVG